MKRIILCMAVFLVACQGPSSQQRVVKVEGEVPKTRTSGNPYAECNSQKTRKVVELANEARDDDGLGELYCDAELAAVAMAHAQDMCEHNYLSHTSRDGRQMQDRAEAAGVDFMALGENVAMGQRSAEQVHANWMDSPGHRANIMREMFTRLGVAYVPCDGTPFWVQVFAN